MLRVIYNKQRHGRKSGGNHEPLKYSEEIIVVEVPAWKCSNLDRDTNQDT